MTVFNLNVTDRKTAPGLYCVWVPVRNDGRTQLISIWVDPKMAVFERCDQDHIADHAASATQTEEATTEQTEDPGRRRLHIRAA